MGCGEVTVWLSCGECEEQAKGAKEFHTGLEKVSVALGAKCEQLATLIRQRSCLSLTLTAIPLAVW
jgi:hypothetical protein